MRSLFASVLQAASLVLFVTAGFLESVPAGLFAVGAVCAFVGYVAR